MDGQLSQRCTSTGKSFARYDRLENAHYSDCEWQMRRAKSQADLPPVRQIVNKVFRGFSRDLSRATRIPNFLSAMMGQYIAHDIASRTNAVAVNETIDCCTNKNEEPIPIADRHPACCPIEVPDNDPDFAANFPQMHCISMFRSKVVPKRNSNVSPADQLNEATAFMDNSNLYGSEVATHTALRTGRGGQMKSNAENILPEKDNKFYLGDARLNQTPQLMVLHSIYLREHNRIAKILQGLNAHWNENRLFEETRRIVIAQFQHVVYEEFLPAYVDSKLVQRMDNSIFGPKLDAVVFNEFSSSIFRILHSVIPTDIHLISSNNTFTTFKLHRIINNMQLIRTNYDDIVRGLLVQPINPDGYDPELFHGLFVENENEPGTDLLSIDLTRGRDHGLPPYVNFLSELKGGVPVTKFKHLAPYISEENIARLSSTYESVEDIDLLVGSILETPMDGWLMGPTAQGMFYSQFRRLKAADPYFYTNPDSPNPFTKQQLKEIKKASTNLLFCLNSGVKWVPRHPSISPVRSSHLVSCDSLPKISYASWRERRLG